MAKAKTETVAGFVIPDGAKMFLGLLVQAAAQALLDWLARKNVDVQAQANAAAKAEMGAPAPETPAA